MTKALQKCYSTQLSKTRTDDRTPTHGYAATLEPFRPAIEHFLEMVESAAMYLAKYSLGANETLIPLLTEVQDVIRRVMSATKAR
jgi:hypothetical protein